MTDDVQKVSMDALSGKARKAALTSSFTNVLLSFLKFAAGTISGSIALVADAIHSFSDIFPSLAVYFGIKISERKPTKEFPYGFHKVENLISLFISLVIFYGAYHMIMESITKFGVSKIENINLAVSVALASLIISYLITRYKIKVGTETGSPSLIADGQHSRIDVIASLAVLIGVSGSFFGLYMFDPIAGIIASIFVIRAGYEIFKDSTKVLLDACLNYEILDEVKGIAEKTPGVKKVNKIRARGSGRYIYVELEIETDAKIDIEKAHLISETLDAKVKKQIKNIDKVLILVEPEEREFTRIAVPLEDNNGLNSKISPHFGTAKYFGIVDVKDEEVLKIEIEKNPYLSLEKRKGIIIAEWLGEKGIDEVYLKEPLKRGPVYAFSNYYVLTKEMGQEKLFLKDLL